MIFRSQSRSIEPVSALDDARWRRSVIKALIHGEEVDILHGYVRAAESGSDASASVDERTAVEEQAVASGLACHNKICVMRRGNTRLDTRFVHALQEAGHVLNEEGNLARLLLALEVAMVLQPLEG